ncbi:hypothetical protein BBK36DRAFT_1118914, partial [Trichoderma citrinoviride]
TDPGTPEALPNAVSIPDEAHEDARSRATYSSFGENGLTATANAYGHLLQITQYHEDVPSGFVSVDLETTEEPYFVAKRAHNLQRQSLDPSKGIRLLFEESNDKTPRPDVWETDPPTLRMTPPPSPRKAPPKGGGRQVRVMVPDTEARQASTPPPRIYSFKHRPGAPSLSRVPRIIINADLLLRNLDFSTRDTLNARNLEDPSYTIYIPTRGHCVVRVHKRGIKGEDESDVQDSEGMNDDRDSIALFITPFINGIRQQPTDEDGNLPRIDDAPQTRKDGNFYVTADQRVRNSNSNKETLEITLAYTLQLFPSEQLETSTSPVSEADLEEAKQRINTESLTPISISADRHLDFILHRNLEHILSVCSIPVNIGSGETPAIALTCGDVSGHRVTRKASFHAFQFLLSAFRFFDSKSKEPCSGNSNGTYEAYSTGMRNRILDICWGHMNWLFRQVDENDDLVPHTWANGQAIANWGNHKSLPNKSVVDGCYQIIKIIGFYRTAATREMATHLIQRLGGIVSNWVRDLHQFKQKEEFIFPHCLEDAPQTFHLSDHAMIWFTLRLLEDFKPSLEDQMSLQHLNLPDLLRQGSGHYQTTYSSSKIQRSILKNFVTQSKQLNETLLTATSRSICETSFLLQDQDTTTIHCMAEGLFDKPSSGSTSVGTSVEESASVGGSSGNLDDGYASIWGNKVEPWKRTLGIQELQSANNDERWVHPLRFALAMILSEYNIRINSRSAPDMHDYAKSTLLNSSSPNGLIPGQLGENKKPVFQADWMRDSYWHTTFEVPCILWRSMEYLLKGKGANSSDSSNTLLSDTPDVCCRLEGAMKRREPLILSMDQLRTTHKWLYCRPSFFRLNINLSSEAVIGFCETRKHTDESSSGSGFMDRAVDAAQEWGWKEVDFGYIIDIAKNKTAKIGQRTSTLQVQRHEDMGRFIGGFRDPAKAKKRFFHFYEADLGIALHCYLASSEREQMSSFFDRHASYSKYFFEDKATLLNKWATEMHLTFYTYQHASNKRASHTIPSQDRIEFPSSVRRDQPTWISHAVMSFRFDGDIFDRYWTCHFFEANGNIRPGFIDEMTYNGTLGSSWQQRRVLELLLFDTILNEMIQHTRKILKEVINTVLQSSNVEYSEEIDESSLLRVLESFPKVDSNLFASLNELWNKFQRILQVIEDDLRENLAVIEVWMDREERRRTFKLQWATAKEQIHGDAGLGLKLANDHKIHELKRCLANVASFNILLTRRLEVMRSGLEMRSNVNIRLFTYVTVVFLPISFATSVFSMNGTPPKDTLVKMAKTAGVALAITAVALLNAKVLAATLRTGVRKFYQPVRFFAELAFLILLSLISSMPREYIYLFHRYSVLPVRKVVSGQPNRNFFHEGIESELEQIRVKISQVEKHRYWKKERDRILQGEEKRSKQSNMKDEKERKRDKRDEMSTWEILEIMGRAWLKLERREGSHEVV